MPDVVLTSANIDSLFDPIQKSYILFGEDDHQKDEALARLRSFAIDPAFDDFDFEQIDAQSSTPDSILSAVSIVPFASKVRLVVVRGAELYRKRDKQGDADRLASGIASLGGSSCLIFRVGAAEEAQSGKTALSAKLDAAVRAVGSIVRCKALSQEALADWLIAYARDAGKSLDSDAAMRLIQGSADDRSSLQNEIEKAICFSGASKTISIEMVEAICCSNAEDVMFKLVDSISQRNADRSLTLLHEILRFDNKPQSVAGRFLSLLGRQFRLLWQADALSGQGVPWTAVRNPPSEVAEQLPAEGSITSMAWKAGDLYRMAKSWNRDNLSRAFDLVLECDMANKGSGEGNEDVVTNMEMLIIKLCVVA